jgi:hypothetical protein
VDGFKCYGLYLLSTYCWVCFQLVLAICLRTALFPSNMALIVIDLYENLMKNRSATLELVGSLGCIRSFNDTLCPTALLLFGQLFKQRRHVSSWRNLGGIKFDADQAIRNMRADFVQPAKLGWHRFLSFLPRLCLA